MKEAVTMHIKHKYPDWMPREQKHVENAKRLNLKPIKPYERPGFLIKYNPLYAGAVILDMVLKMEEAGVALAGHRVSIFATAHLFDALRQQEIIDMSWPAMDCLMLLQIGPIFANSLPTTLEAILTHLEPRTGLESSSHRVFDKRQPSKFHLCGAGMGFRSSLAYEVIRKHAAHLLQYDWLADNHPRNKHRKPRRHRSPIKFENEFSAVTAQLLSDIRTNYIGFIRICNDLMVAIRAKLYRELNLNVPLVREGNDSRDHGPLYMMFDVLCENKKAAAAHARAKIREPFQGGEHFKSRWQSFRRLPRQQASQANQAGEAPRMIFTEIASYEAVVVPNGLLSLSPAFCVVSLIPLQSDPEKNVT